VSPLSLRKTLTLGTLATVNLAVGFAINWYVWFWFGAGRATDALFAGVTLPNFILTVVGGSLSSVLVPLFSGEREHDMRANAAGLTLAVGASFLVVSVVLWLTAGLWVALIVPGFDRSALDLTVRLTRVQVWSMAATGVIGVLWARCSATARLVRAETAGLTSSILALLALLLLLPPFGIDAAAWVFTGRVVLQAGLLLPELFPLPRVRFAAISRSARQVWPLVIGASYYKTDLIIDRILASMTAPGGLSTLHLVQQLYSGVNQVINRAITAPLLPLLVEAVKTARWDTFRHAYRRGVQLTGGTSGLLWVSALGAAAALSAMAPAVPLESADARLLTIVLLTLGGYLVAGAAGQVTSGALYAIGDTRTPPLIGAIGFTLGIGLKLAGVTWIGTPGIALGTTIYYVLNLGLLHRMLIRRLEQRGRD
jgi:putative peptidoglycan lipid II flippase